MGAVTVPIVSKICPECHSKVSVSFCWRPGRDGRELHTHVFAGNCSHYRIGTAQNGEPQLMFEETKQCK